MSEDREFGRLEARVDRLESLRQRALDSLPFLFMVTILIAQLAWLDRKFSDIDARFDRIESRVTVVETRLVAIEAALARIEAKLGTRP